MWRIQYLVFEPKLPSTKINQNTQRQLDTTTILLGSNLHFSIALSVIQVHVLDMVMKVVRAWDVWKFVVPVVIGVTGVMWMAPAVDGIHANKSLLTSSKLSILVIRPLAWQDKLDLYLYICSARLTADEPERVSLNVLNGKYAGEKLLSWMRQEIWQLSRWLCIPSSQILYLNGLGN